MRFELLFRKIKGKLNPVSHLIGWFTKSKYCHVAGRFVATASPLTNNIAWTLSFHSTAKGFASEVISGNPDKWDIVPVKLKPFQVERLFLLCELDDGRIEYDWAGLLTWPTFGLVKQDPRKDYCSETFRRKLGFRWIKGLSRWGGEKCSPQDLYDLVTEKL